MNAQLCYFGGSGGFFALWHILLGTDYSCVLQNTYENYDNIRGSNWPKVDELPVNINELPIFMEQEIKSNKDYFELVQQVLENKNGSPRCINSGFYKSQWDVSEDRSKWKQTEKWPENLLTQKSNFKNKLFFHCNPAAEDMIADGNKKILLYTDIETQLMLAKSKNAWTYFDKNIEQFESIEKPQTTKFNGYEVFHEVDKIAEYTDYQVKLQDIVTTQGQALLDIFGLTINENNIYHNNKWLNLHTDEEKGRLLNESQNSTQT